MGFKLRNAVKSVTKAVGQTAKVAIAPAAIVAASTLDAVGARGAASKVIDKTALNKSLAKTEKHVSSAAGWGIDAAALAIAGTAAAPALSSAAGTVGHAAAAGLKYGGGTLASFFRRSPKAGTADNPEVLPSDGPGNALADAASSLAHKVGKSLHGAAAGAGDDLANKVRSAVQGKLARIPGLETGATIDANAGAAGSALPWWAIPLAIAAMLLLAFIGSDRRK